MGMGGGAFLGSPTESDRDYRPEPDMSRVGGSKRRSASRGGGLPPTGGNGDGGKGDTQFQPDFVQQMVKLLQMLGGQGKGAAGVSGEKGGGQNKRITLDEKYFRRMGVFSGDSSKFRPWFFDLIVCVWDKWMWDWGSS